MSVVALPWAPQASHPGRTAAGYTVPPLRHHLFALTLTASEAGGEAPAGTEACSGAPRTLAQLRRRGGDPGMLMPDWTGAVQVVR
jgi:hypothetical protein